MFRKSLAVLISGVLVLGSSSAVFAADAATSTPAEATDTQSTTDEDLVNLIGSFLGEDGESIDLEGLIGAVTDENGEVNLAGLLGGEEGEEGSLDLGGLVSGLLGGAEGEEGSFDLGGLVSGLLGGAEGEEGSFDLGGLVSGLLGGEEGEEGSLDLNALLGGLLGGEEGEVDLEALLGSVVDENGNFDLSGLLEMFGVDESSLDIAGILAMIGGIGGESFSEELKTLEAEAGVEDGEEVTMDEVETMINGLVSNPDEVTALVSSLFKEGGIGASVLDLVGSTDDTISGVVDSMKDDSGEYSLDRMAEAFGSVEVNDEGISIEGQEISAEEIENTVNQLLEAFGLSEEAAATSEAAASEAA